MGWKSTLGVSNDMFPNASWLEWAWTIVCAIGFVVRLWLLIDAQKDVEAQLHDIINGRKRRLARANRRGRLVALYMVAVFVAIGIVAMLRPPAPGASNMRPDMLSLFTAFAFISATVLTVLDDILDMRDRKAMLNDQLTRQEQAAAALNGGSE